MPENSFESTFVTLRTFKSLYDQYYDFCRKLRFFIKGAFTIQEESLALEIISELLDQKEKDLEMLRAQAFDESRNPDPRSESMELLLGRSLMQSEDYRLLRRLSDIRKNGGQQWETLQALLRDTYPPKPDGNNEG